MYLRLLNRAIGGRPQVSGTLPAVTVQHARKDMGSSWFHTRQAGRSHIWGVPCEAAVLGRTVGTLCCREVTAKLADAMAAG